jgi:hypothetical protein
MKKIEDYQSQYMFCDGINCSNDIGFISKFGKKHFDDGVYNIGYQYFCKKCAKKAKTLIIWLQ